ncbi:MAG: ImmA/IrrE family metallo-endopeptidase [Candidatus Hodarchaeota archaeon]
MAKFKLTKEQREFLKNLDENQKQFVIENYKRDWEYENSLEGIKDNLGCLQVGHNLEVVIVKTLQNLPRKVRNFVYKNCAFTSIPEAGGQALCKQKIKRPWLIILDYEADENTVAHEIAHAWLGHKIEFPDMLPSIEWIYRIEKEACEQATKWGFKSELEQELIEAYKSQKRKNVT